MLTELSQQQLELIYAYRHILLMAQNYTGVPWIALAAIWYRESSLTFGRNPFQFDPVPAQDYQKYLYEKYSTTSPHEISTYLFQGVNNFQAAAVLAACFLKHKGAGFLTGDQVKNSFWAYNGRAYGSAEKSPYVMNNVDQWHKDMHIKGTIDGKPLPPNTIDKQLGAYGVWLQLREKERELKHSGSDCPIIPLQLLESDDPGDEQAYIEAPGTEKGERA